MTKITVTGTPLSEWCKKHSNRRVKEIIGCSDSAVTQMLQSDRTIVVTSRLEVVEIKRLGNAKKE